MKRSRAAGLALALLVVGPGSSAVTETGPQAGPDSPHHVVARPNDIKWVPAPAKLPPGAQMAVLDGDPTKPGASSTIRAKLPDGYSVPPHTHPTDEHMTVIQGAILLGMGPTFDRSKLRELPAGSYARLPSTQPHFNLYKGQTIIQLHGIGPYDVIYVNRADDPTRKRDTK